MEDDKGLAMANTYRMTDEDIRLMIELRATNSGIFTGRRNSALRGWRAIRKEMGLQRMMSARQMKKKWDNLKEKYKTLRNPPEGMQALTQPSSWRWYHLMDEAMSGRLVGTAAIVEPSSLDEDEDLSGAPPQVISHTGRDFSEMSPVETETMDGHRMLGQVLDHSRPESPAEAHMMEIQPVIKSQPTTLYATLLPDCTTESQETPSSSRMMVAEAADMDRTLEELLRERQVLEREQVDFDRELISLERDRELLNRDMVNLERGRAAVERDRAAVERDREAVERDRVVLDRDRAFLDRDRAFLDRDRVFLDRAREDLERERMLLRRDRTVLDGDQTEVTTEKEVLLQTRFYQGLVSTDLDPDQLETRQRLVCLFQKLVEKL